MASYRESCVASYRKYCGGYSMHNPCCVLMSRNGRAASARCQNGKPIRSWRRGVTFLQCLSPILQYMIHDLRHDVGWPMNSDNNEYLPAVACTTRSACPCAGMWMCGKDGGLIGVRTTHNHKLLHCASMAMSSPEPHLVISPTCARTFVRPINHDHELPC